MKRSQVAKLLLAVLLACACQPLFTLGASALERAKMMKLQIYADDNARKSFGRLDLFMQKLRSAGHSCRVSNYAYGGEIACGPFKGPRILFGFVFAPTHAPEFLLINSIRAHGVDGGELPKEKFDEFLESILKPAASPAK